MTDFSRIVALDRIGPSGFEQVIEADPAERAALAERMRIPAVHSLRCAFRLRRVTGGIFEAQGVLDASVDQVCVVSLEPFTQPVQEDFALQFVPAGTEAPDDDLEAPDQIGYEGNAIDLGEAAAQQLALALDPYPRKPGLEEAPEAEPARDSPFAALAPIRRTQ